MGGRKQKKSKVQKVPRAGNVFGKVFYLLGPATTVASTQWRVTMYCAADLAAKRVHRVAKTLDGVAQTAQ